MILLSPPGRVEAPTFRWRHQPTFERLLAGSVSGASRDRRPVHGRRGAGIHSLAQGPGGLGLVGALLLSLVFCPALGSGCKSRDCSGDREVKGSAASEGIPEADRKTLLLLARRSLVAAVSGREPLTDGLAISDRLKRSQGAFVTLKKGGRLRGCIGTIMPRDPLYRAVILNARNAALHDGRFSPVTAAELPQIHIEISALSVPRPVESFRDIVVGTHGIILSRGGRSATFLPHVATEQRWDRSTTLTHLARKAGLAAGAWRQPGTSFHVYTAEVWGEGQD